MENSPAISTLSSGINPIHYSSWTATELRKETYSRSRLFMAFYIEENP